LAGFLYFRSSDTRPITKDGIAKLGLSYAFSGHVTTRPTAATSPSGKSGLVLAEEARHDGKTVGYFPDQQTWRKFPSVEGRPECWVGYWNDAKPGPLDLARVKQLKGVPLTLADGNQWDIPIVRSFDGAQQEWISRLPSAWVCDENGDLVPGTEPKAAYAHLWELTAPLADKILAIASGDEVDWVPDAQVGKVVKALLQTNYHVDATEIGLLEIVGGEDAFAIIAVASRYDTLQDWMDQKKTSDPSAESGAILSSGEAA
jgi:hypothetical protein